MSEVIEDFIRRHPGLPEGESFEAFLREPRIRAWVGDDATRRDRLHREFSRVWGHLQPATTGPTATVTTARPAPPQPMVREVPREAPAPRAVPVDVPAHPQARRLHLLCPTCARLDVWLQAGVITCHHCGTSYDDMLALVPVKPVGPFAYVFGEGAKGILTAGGVALLLLAVYGVLKWL